MNLHQLRYFVTLARIQHYRRAAEELMITQPSLSHSIANLEEELGTRLFEKTGRNVVLTKYGMEFLACAENTLGTLDDGIQRIQSMTGEDEGVIDLGFIYTRGNEFIPRVVKHFLDENPDKKIHFTFENGATTAMLDGLKKKKFDAVFCSRIEDEKNVEFTPVSEEELVAIVPMDHELADRESVSLEELGNYPQIGFSKNSGLYQVINDLYAREGVKRNIVYEMEEDMSLAGMVSFGLGVAILPRIPTLDYMNVKVIPIENINYRRYIYLAVLKDRFQPPLCREFIEFIRKNYAIRETE